MNERPALGSFAKQHQNVGVRDPLRSVLCRLAAVLCIAAWASGCGYDQVIHSWIDHSVEFTDPAGARLPGHVYVVRGYSNIFSLGMDELAEKITHRGVTATVHEESDYVSLAEDIVRAYKAHEVRGPIMLVGHSAGGARIVSIAETLKQAGVPVALAVAFDPTRNLDVVPPGVGMFINLYQDNNTLGGGEALPGPGFRGRLINVDLREHSEILHITLDKEPTLHDVVVDKIIAVARAARRPSGATQADSRPLVMKYTVPHDAPIELWDSVTKVKVKSAETPETVGSTYGAPAWAIAQLNGLEPDQPIEPGRMLIIPRSMYTNAITSAPAPSPRRRPLPSAPLISSTKPIQEQAPTAAPAVADQSPAPNGNSFGDRWHPQATQ